MTRKEWRKLKKLAKKHNLKGSTIVRTSKGLEKVIL